MRRLQLLGAWMLLRILLDPLRSLVLVLLAMLVWHLDLNVNGHAGVMMRTSAVLQKGFATLSNVDRATGSWQKASDRQIEFLNQQVPAFTTQLNGNLEASHGAIDALRDFLRDHASPAADKAGDAAGDVGGTARQATADLKTVDSAVASGKVLLDSLNLDIDNLGRPCGLQDAAGRPLPCGVAVLAMNRFNDLLTSPDLATAMHAGAGTARNLEGISGDLHTYSHPLLNPDPCTTKKCVAGRIFSRVAGMVGVAADFERVTEPWRAVRVHVLNPLPQPAEVRRKENAKP